VEPNFGFVPRDDRPGVRIHPLVSGMMLLVQQKPGLDMKLVAQTHQCTLTLCLAHRFLNLQQPSHAA
jgi:hypothetical protein